MDDTFWQPLVDQWAARLNGRVYGAVLTREEKEALKEDGLAIVSGGSDDLAEFDGVIDDEAGVSFDFGPTVQSKILLGPNGLMGIPDGEAVDRMKLDELTAWVLDLRDAATITCHKPGRAEGAFVFTTTDLVHAPFTIIEDDGRLYSKSLVFRPSFSADGRFRHALEPVMNGFVNALRREPAAALTAAGALEGPFVMGCLGKMRPGEAPTTHFVTGGHVTPTSAGILTAGMARTMAKIVEVHLQPTHAFPAAAIEDALLMWVQALQSRSVLRFLQTDEAPPSQAP